MTSYIVGTLTVLVVFVVTVKSITNPPSPRIVPYPTVSVTFVERG
eukprot:COSAG05_NODE_403_length_10204_cov_874.669372_4_plen_45_part_00